MSKIENGMEPGPATVESLLGQLRQQIEEHEGRAKDAEARCAMLEGVLCRTSYIDELDDQAQEALTELGCWDDLRDAERVRAAKESVLRVAKTVTLPREKEAYDAVVTEVTMEAYAEGAVDGKNAEQRKVQMDGYLATNTRVAKARSMLAAVETDVLAAEAELAVAEIDAKAALNRWYAARSAADLLAAMLHAVAGKG